MDYNLFIGHNLFILITNYQIQLSQLIQRLQIFKVIDHNLFSDHNLSNYVVTNYPSTSPPSHHLHYYRHQPKYVTTLYPHPTTTSTLAFNKPQPPSPIPYLTTNYHTTTIAPPLSQIHIIANTTSSQLASSHHNLPLHTPPPQKVAVSTTSHT